MAVLIMTCAFVSACAAFSAPAATQETNTSTSINTPAPAPAPSTPVPGTDELPSSSTVANLQQLIDSHQLTELRTTYSATYGTSLLFQADKLIYYVALFHNKQFWRVIHTDSYDDAERIYNTFVTQTRDLAQVEIDATRLQAGKAYAERMIALNQERLRNLQQDEGYQQQQAKEVAAAQQQAKQQAMSLSADLHSTSSQLDSMKQRIDALEKQQSNPTLNLPSPMTSAAPTVPATPASVLAPATSQH